MLPVARGVASTYAAAADIEISGVNPRGKFAHMVRKSRTDLGSPAFSYRVFC